MSFPAPAVTYTAGGILGVRIISLGEIPTSQATETKGWDSYRFGMPVARLPSSMRMSAYTHLGRSFEEEGPQHLRRGEQPLGDGCLPQRGWDAGETLGVYVSTPTFFVPGLWRLAGAP